MMVFDFSWSQLPAQASNIVFIEPALVPAREKSGYPFSQAHKYSLLKQCPVHHHLPAPGQHTTGPGHHTHQK